MCWQVMANVLLNTPKLIEKTVANSFYPRQFKALYTLNAAHILPTYISSLIVVRDCVDSFGNHYCAFSECGSLLFGTTHTHIHAHRRFSLGIRFNFAVSYSTTP